ncbi:hypothetical protein QAD02_005177 [Eretmocerus hayati]|uniref:Uncharacterized protein n=1 Tax=Eretmocerus hayati TaxID=131215 RepID=A0ACC2NRM5_9HYME|nr:hypothetical protein QAD02_005177 [Eretmocerus hayati]
MESERRSLSLSILLILINSWRRQADVFCNSQSVPGRLVFEENFDSNDLNKAVWSREVKIAQEPDYQFCVYHKHEETIQIEGGILRIKPRLFEDAYGEDSVLLGQLRLADCTSSIPQECQRRALSFHILPPVISAKLTTRNYFDFEYGIIEIRAKFPEGDWLYPEMWLEPLYKSYDSRYANARIDLGRVRGNARLMSSVESHEELGSRLLQFGVGNGTASVFSEELVSKLKGQGSRGWNRDFHVYRTKWTSKGFTFYVDGELVGKLIPTEIGWSKFDGPELVDMMPFDEKFYLSIGLGVGGIRVFPDRTQTDTYVKPWKNTGAKAMLQFWQSKSMWLPSWQKNQGANTALEIDYIRVWSLDS